jgi:hypothetical protein
VGIRRGGQYGAGVEQQEHAESGLLILSYLSCLIFVGIRRGGQYDAGVEQQEHAASGLLILSYLILSYHVLSLWASGAADSTVRVWSNKTMRQVACSSYLILSCRILSYCILSYLIVSCFIFVGIRRGGQHGASVEQQDHAASDVLILSYLILSCLIFVNIRRGGQHGASVEQQDLAAGGVLERAERGAHLRQVGAAPQAGRRRGYARRPQPLGAKEAIRVIHTATCVDQVRYKAKIRECDRFSR